MCEVKIPFHFYWNVLNASLQRNRDCHPMKIQNWAANNLWSVILRGSGERKINHEKIFSKSCSKIERLREKRKKRNWNQGSCHWNLLNGFDFTVKRRKFWFLIRFSLIADRIYAIYVTAYEYFGELESSQSNQGINYIL